MKTMTDKQFLLAVLSDGREHRLSEILRRSIAERGHAFTCHSRAADLRKDGWTVACWPAKGERDSFYQLIVGESTLGAVTPFSVPQRSGVAASSVDETATGEQEVGGSSTLDNQPALFELKPRGAYEEAA